MQLEASWLAVLGQEFDLPYMQDLRAFLVEEKRHGKLICPPSDQWFSAFEKTPFDKVKVVILGQDPYHGPNQAHGLSFSVPLGIKTPPSLVNIYKEMAADLGVSRSDISNPKIANYSTSSPSTSNSSTSNSSTSSPSTVTANHGCLAHWAEQGVLLLNATLTVEQGQAGSHQNKGWEVFTDRAIQALNEQKEGLVFILWGSYAQKKGAFIDPQRHLVLKSSHPSPLSAYRGFLGSRPFSATNAYLRAHGASTIDWLTQSPANK